MFKEKVVVIHKGCINIGISINKIVKNEKFGEVYCN